MEKLERKNKELQDEIDYLRDQKEREERRRQQEYQEERKRIREDMRQNMCFADNWEDGFTRGIARLRREAEGFDLDDEDERKTADWFNGEADKWQNVERVFLATMGEALDQANKILAEAREEVAKYSEEIGETGLAEALRDDCPSYLVNW